MWRNDSGPAHVYCREFNVYHNLIFVRKYGCSQTSAREYLNGDVFGSGGDISAPAADSTHPSDRSRCPSTEEVRLSLGTY